MYYHAAVVCLQPHRPISQYAAERISQKRCLQYADTVVAHMPVALNGRIVTDCNATHETHLSRDRRARVCARVSFVDAIHSGLSAASTLWAPILSRQRIARVDRKRIGHSGGSLVVFWLYCFPIGSRSDPEPTPPLASLKMQESKLLGFWPIRHDGRIAESPNWLGPILPGEPQQDYQSRSRNVRPILPGEPQPMRYRRTASGYRIAWDEPGENF
jgi:hypothetical protein